VATVDRPLLLRPHGGVYVPPGPFERGDRARAVPYEPGRQAGVHGRARAAGDDRSRDAARQDGRSRRAFHS